MLMCVCVWSAVDSSAARRAPSDYLESSGTSLARSSALQRPPQLRHPLHRPHSVHISTGRSRQGDTSAAVSAFQVEAGSRAACPPSLSEILFAHMVQDGKGTDSGTSSSHSVRGADSTALRRRGSGKRTRTSQGGSDLLRAWIAYGNYNDAHILRREDLVTKVDDAERAQPSE